MTRFVRPARRPATRRTLLAVQPLEERATPATTDGGLGGGIGDIPWVILPVDPAPTVTVRQATGQADPTNGSSIRFDVHFSKPVTGFDATDVRFSGVWGPGAHPDVHIPVPGSALVADMAGSGADYSLTVSGMTGQGWVSPYVPAGAATDSSGNPSKGSATPLFPGLPPYWDWATIFPVDPPASVWFDGVAPTPTVRPAVGQPDLTGVPSVRFDVQFGESVTGFDATDISLAGSTAGGNLEVSVSGSYSGYTVTVTGMTTGGTVAVSIPAGAATDQVGNPSAASADTGNTVTYRNAGTLDFSDALYSATEDGGAVTVTVSRSGGSEGEVSVRYATGAGTARAGFDYTSAAGTLTWADGETASKSFTIDLVDDGGNEGTETIPVTLTDPTGQARLGRTAAEVAIAPSDPVGPGTFRDQDGDRVTVTLGGKVPGQSLRYYLNDPDGDGRGSIERIELSGTDPLRSDLRIAVLKARTSWDGGRVRLGAVTGSGLRTLAARPADLTGAGIDLDGHLGSLVIGNVENGADVIARGGPAQKTTITAGRIGDGTAIELGSTLARLTAAAFGAGSLTAPRIGTMTVRGDLAADVTVTGDPVDPARGLALGALVVGGSVTGSDLRVTGNIGSVTAGSFADSRLVAGPAGDAIGAFHIGAFRVTGRADAFADSDVLARTFGTVALASVDVGNGGDQFGIHAAERIGSLRIMPSLGIRFDPTAPVQGFQDFQVTVR